jgi:hypothetical protein
VTIGEGKLAAEVQRSNDCLKARISMLEDELKKCREDKGAVDVRLAQLQDTIRKQKKKEGASVPEK